ncbi:MAG: hydantoinase B/oxoprolinase family protein, partial [Pseudomonadota bacterium]|nr:hydantoinase B/oxoprolinase family protein [Pseudomonadota bacterium]
HADIGGRTPGSMDPFATTLEQEGVVFDNFLLVSDGRLREAQVRRHLASAVHPARNIDERVSDLLAQLAANQLGARELAKLTGEHGVARIRAYMAHVQTNAGRCVARALDGLLGNAPQRRIERTDSLDDGTPLRVILDLRRDAAGAPELTVDFAGTAAWQPNSFNAPPAVARAALVYVLRCLVADDIPLNDGCLAAVRLKLPPDSLLCPPPDAAVVAGNVETAQRLVDLLLGALGVAAASQGTMNNLLFGWDGEDGGRQYYETIGGGGGATATAPGASGVQVHMTNTRITDPEVLEWRLRGVRLRRFALRAGSGGRGRQRGGDGLIREFEILTPCDCTLLTQRRTVAPFGLAGGEDGATGRNRLRRADAEEQALPAMGHWRLQPGDRLTIETPGGGGYGPADRES